MTMTKASASACLTFALCLLPSAFAEAALVRFSTGSVMSVESCQITGDTATIALRGGGQLIVPKSTISEVLPDEYFHATPEPLPARPVVAASGTDRDIRALVDRLAARYGVDSRLAHAVVTVESNYEPRAVSPKGAKGLMQLMPSVAQDYALDDPFDPEKNVDTGLRYLRGLLDKYEDVKTALAAYNAGPAAVARYGGIPPYRETRDYVNRIMSLVVRP
jgi:soluble lytic murein transglycosylase-like protein